MISNYIVPIPKERISYKKSRDPEARYVYYVTKRYRNKNGTPTGDEKLIGKEYPAKPGWMVPNKQYFTYFPNQSEIQPMQSPVYIRQAGQGMFLTMLAENLSLTGVLEETFPEVWRELLMCAIYMVCEGNVMMNADFFWDEIQVPKGFNLSSQRISELFHSMSAGAPLEFFKEWSKLTLENHETVAYDVTSVSTYADHEMAEYGYNRDREVLPQVNFGLLYGTLSRLPVAYALYSGSINDLTFFPYMMRLAEEVEASNVFYVLDRGFVSQKNIAFAHDNKIEFLACAPKGEKLYKEEMQKVSEEIQHPKYRIPGTELNGLVVTMDIEGNEYGLYIYFSKTNAALEENKLYGHIERLEEEIKSEMKPKRHHRYNRFYKVESTGEGEICSYERDYNKIAEACKLLGMFSLLCTKKTMTAAEALDLYGRRSGIEKVYDVSKNELESDRFLTHTDKTTRGKHFVHFLALILWSDLTRKVKSCNKKPEKTIERMLLQMKKIKCLNYEIGRVLEEPLTRKQKDILDCCGINEGDFTKRILIDGL